MAGPKGISKLLLQYLYTAKAPLMVLCMPMGRLDLYPKEFTVW